MRANDNSATLVMSSDGIRKMLQKHTSLRELLEVSNSAAMLTDLSDYSNTLTVNGRHAVQCDSGATSKKSNLSDIWNTSIYMPGQDQRCSESNNRKHTPAVWAASWTLASEALA